jgi:lipoprotein-anchoring transpeptidase ErfK/SrfK
MTGLRPAALLLAGLLAVGCAPGDLLASLDPPREAQPADLAVYAARMDGDRLLPAIEAERFPPSLLRTRVPYETIEAPGTVVIDTAAHQLFLVEPDGWATRYGVAIGKEGFGWTGTGTIDRNARWPRWTPPPEMIARNPSLEKWRDGMPGGLDNPLGARALYIYFAGVDSGFRIHGTTEPFSIGRSASSGCFRMLNQDVIDLYDRVQKGAKVIVV